jgi:hypothetical protein
VKSLKDLGELQNGYQYRSAKDREPIGDSHYRAVQLSSLTQDNQVDWENLEAIHFPSDPDRYRLREGDLLVPLRGVRSLVTRVENPPKDALVIGQLVVFRPSPNLLESRYVAAYLNHPMMQQKIVGLRRGTGIPFIPIEEFSKMRIHQPSLADQIKIARVYELRQQERKLLNQIEELREELVNAVMMKAAIACEAS